MEPLLKQVQELPAKLQAMSSGSRLLLVAGLVATLVLAGTVALVATQADSHEFVFTNLTPEDSSEAAAALKGAGIPFRLESAGAAISVPSSKVHEARLMLATAGLPRGAGVGFELFDRGDLGVTEFTQRVNLRRAIEGEVARTISRMAEVRSARVHISLPERGFYRDDERKASAAVVVSLQPGRTIADRQIAGIRHLVASAVPGLSPNAVTIVDGRGAALTTDGPTADPALSFQGKLERDLEQRVVTLLETVVGAGAVVARVNATMDTSEVRSSSEQFDPDQTALRTERTVNSSQNAESQALRGTAGAVANQPLVNAERGGGPENKSSASGNELTRSFEISKVVTTTVSNQPRLLRLSLAILLDGVEGKPRPEAEVARLGELAKRAVGFDAERGDQMDVSSAVFTRSAEAGEGPAVSQRPALWWLSYAAAAAAVVAVLLVVLALLRRRAVPATATREALSDASGLTVAELEARLGAEAVKAKEPPALPDPAVIARERARELASADPARAVLLLKAWLEEEPAEDLVQESANA